MVSNFMTCQIQDGGEIIAIKTNWEYVSWLVEPLEKNSV